jgi:aryl-alcohol dehydrogenase-like predicted oxidoreductase
MINRREFVGITLGASAALALKPELLFAQKTLLQRAIPSSGEMLPVISFAPRSLGGAAMSSQPADVAAIKAVLKTFLDNGGKVVDVLHGGPIGEQAARTAAEELGIQNRLFWTTPLAGPPPQRGASGPPPKPDAAAVRAVMEEKFAKFKVNRIDLVMVSAGNAIDNPAFLSVLREMKKEGRVRYIGVHDLAPPPYPTEAAFARLESLMRNEPIDIVGTDYAVGWRGVEEKLLPLALERKIGFMAYFPFDRARFFNRATAMPLPEWAAEFDAKTWAQFCLKYVLSHPAVIVARTGTTKAEHMLDNIGGGIGRLPNEAMRKRMAQLVDSLPPTPAPAPQVIVMPPPQAPGIALSAAILERYVGEWKTPSGSSTLTFRRDGTTLMLKANTNPEVPLAARSETRLQSPQGPLFEFQVDAAGKVTGIILEQGNPLQRIPLTRIR